MMKRKADRWPGDDDEGEEVERSDTEDTGVQKEGDEDKPEMENNSAW